MKTKHLLFTLLALFASITASAETWTDENGTKWYFIISGSKATIANRGYSSGSYTPSISGNIPTSLTIPATVYNGTTAYPVTSIGQSAFYNCSNLTAITIPEGVTSIGSSAFFDCSSLTAITIPNSVTSIGSTAFQSCSSLTAITIPNSVTSIEYDAFYETSAVIHLIGTTPPTVKSSSFSNANVLYVPSSALEAYRSNEVWSTWSLHIIADNVQTDYEVTIEAKADRPALLVAIGEENLANVVNLKVHGTLNGYDVMVLRNKMVNLHHLDLGDATLVANDNGYQYYTGCSVREGVFGANFFDGCANLQSIIFPKDITSIGYYALRGTNLSSVTIPEGVTTIGSRAFYNIRSLKKIIFPSTLKSIESYAFDECNGFTELRLPPSLKTIGDWAFGYCSGLTELRLPPSVKRIGNYAFNSCSALTEVRIPSSITSIGEGAFGSCNNVKKVYTYTLEPTSINQNTFSTFSTATLYVPHQSYWTYWMNTQWSQFLTINEFNEPYEYFYLNGDYTLDDDTGTLDGNPDADLNDGSGLIVDGSDTQGLDDVNQNQNGDGTGSSIIGNDDGENTGNLDVNYLHINITVSANKWYFFCFPFNVNVADCTYPGDYVWKEYKGQLRATTGKGWKTFDGNLLEAFHGYGFRTNKAGTLVITVQKPKFGGDRPETLLEYIAENIQDASWNLIGNAYSSYYNFTEQDFDAPFTVWNGSSYVAYRPGDDDYHLRPYEAFFTQKPSHADKVQFKAERRETHKQSQATAAQQAQRRRERGINPDRLLTNLFITDNDTAYVDRTRVVLNERASHDYEIECDAAKFLSTDAPAQLYTTGDNVQYAINERPAAGDIHLAYVAMKAGQLSIGAERMDQPMVLVDTEMGTTFDLSLGTYDFTTEAGTFEHRFLLRPASGVVTALADLRQQTGVLIGQQTGGIAIGGAEGKTVNVYTTDGALVASHNGNGFVALKRGIYVINVDGKTAKMPVR